MVAVIVVPVDTAVNEDDVSMPSDRIRKMELTADNKLLCLIDDDNVVLFNPRTCRFEAPSPEEAQAAMVTAVTRIRKNRMI